MRVLLVEDERPLREAIEYILKKENYTVDTAKDGEEGEDLALSNIYDIVILDRMLPKKEGTEILKSMRKEGVSSSVLILTAKDGISDRVYGLDAGADDYLIKPFDKEELLARLRALKRRNRGVIEEDNITFLNTVFSANSAEVTANGETINLTLKECNILELLLRNRNLIVKKEQILDRVWGFESDAQNNNIEVYLSYIRKKLSMINSDIEIETIRGMGYIIKEK